MKDRLKLFIIGISGGLCLLLLYAAFGYYFPKDLGDRTVSVIIQEGDGFNSVAKQLIDGEVVRSQVMLKIPARLRKIDKTLIPGRYDFTGKHSVKRVLDRLEAGDYLKLRMTVYEGAPIWKVASIMQERLDADSAYIMTLAEDSSFCYKLGVPYLEGYLFPETYFVKWGTPIEEVIEDMVTTFKRMTDTVWVDSIPNDLTREEVIVLASIVEAEAYLESEMPRIASVYHNRLRERWRLDADPTVIYGLGGLDRPLSRTDLRRRTPYNTYRMRGLPPTPINSPGLAAIRATIRPEETEFFFFVADGSGGHRFSRTNDEHNRARREIRSNNN